MHKFREFPTGKIFLSRENCLAEADTRPAMPIFLMKNETKMMKNETKSEVSSEVDMQLKHCLRVNPCLSFIFFFYLFISFQKWWFSGNCDNVKPDAECKTRMLKGECESNALVMYQDCPRTCNRCGFNAGTFGSTFSIIFLTSFFWGIGVFATENLFQIFLGSGRLSERVRYLRKDIKRVWYLKKGTADWTTLWKVHFMLPALEYRIWESNNRSVLIKAVALSPQLAACEYAQK